MKVLPGVKQIHSITDAIFQSLVAHIDSDLCEKEDDKVLALLKEVMLGLLPEQTTDNILYQLNYLQRCKRKRKNFCLSHPCESETETKK